MKNADKTNCFDKDFLWLFQKIEYAAICVSLDHHIVDLTPEAEKIFGISRKKMLRKPVDSLFERVGLKITFSQNKKKPVSLITDNNAANKNPSTQKILKLKWQIKPKNTANDKPIGFIVYTEEKNDSEYLSQIYKEVTGQEKPKGSSIKEYVDSLRSYLENVIACMPGLVYWTDKNSFYLGCNDNDAKFLGLASRKEIRGISYEDMEKKANWLVGHTAKWKKDDQEVMATGKPKLNVEEKPILLPNERETFLLTNRVPLFDSKKNAIGIVGISIDITDHKLMEKELQKTKELAENKQFAKINHEVTGQPLDMKKPSVTYAKNIKNYLETIIACMPGDVYWVDQNCVYLGCNDNAARFLGLNSRKEIVGMTYEDLAKKAKGIAYQFPIWKQNNLEVILTGKPKLNVEEKPILLPNNKERHYLTNRVPLFNDKNNVIGVVGIAIDITDRKNADKLNNEKEIAEKTSKFMSRLAGSIAHEIRTPLAIIGINTDLLERTKSFATTYKENKVKIKHFKTIKYAIRLASRIMDNVLIMIRTLSSDHMAKNESQLLSIAESIERALETYPFLDHERALISLDKTKDFTYYGNNILTQHMLFNLIKNSLIAIKEAGKGKMEIKLEKGTSINKLIFSDTALGISKQLLSKIFDQFETRNSFNVDEKSGLGLAFCKMVMQSYGGNISCSSEVNKHAQFILSFPSITKNDQ
jgi:PAS domain S-box-containing protein